MTTAWQDKSLAEKIIDRQTQYETIRQPYDDRMAEIVDFVDLDLTAWDGSGEGEFRGEKLYEGTPAYALLVMADGWIGNLVIESNLWMKYYFADKILRDDDTINQYLQDLEDSMYAIYRQSNFYEALSPFTTFGLSVGSPVIIPYEDNKSGEIKFEVPQPRENYHGPLGAYHRKYEFTVLEAVQKFMGGKVPENNEDSKLSPSIINDYKNGKHTTKYTFIRAIYQQDDAVLEKEKVEFRSKPWMEFYVELNAPETHKKKEPLLFQGYWTKPHIKWDYRINQGEYYARTPAWFAIMDIRSGQQLAKQRLEAGQRALNAPMWVQKKFKGRLHLQPKGVTYYDVATEAGLIPKPIQDKIDYPIGIDTFQMVQTSVREWFCYDLFRRLHMLSQQEGRGSWPTATHIIQLNAETATILAPRVSPYTNVIREIDNRVQDINRRIPNKLPQLPDRLLEYMAYRRQLGDKKINIGMQFLGPLSQMQQKGQTLGRVQTGLAIIGEFVKFDQDLVHKVRLSQSLERSLEQVGFYQDTIVPEAEYQEGRAMRMQQVDNENALIAASQAADTVPKLSKTIESGSPLATMIASGQEAA